MTNPMPGQVYAFQYSDHEVTNQILPLLVVDVDKTHVYYTFPDCDFANQNTFRRVYPMIKSVWNDDANRALIGIVKMEEQNA